MSRERLFERGETRVYRGEHLGAISFALGGIGAGCIQMDGKARAAIWQIFNNYNQASVPDSFFAVRASVAGGKAVVRVRSDLRESLRPAGIGDWSDLHAPAKHTDFRPMKILRPDGRTPYFVVSGSAVMSQGIQKYSSTLRKYSMANELSWCGVP